MNGNGISKDISREIVAILANTYYGWQNPRISFMSAARNLIRKRIENLPLRVPENKKENKDASINRYIDQHLDELLEEVKEKLTDTEKIYVTSFIETGKLLKREENKTKKLIEQYLKSEPMWEWLKNIRGISAILAINLLKYFDIRKAKHPSSFWKYAGLHVENGVAPKRVKKKKLDFNLKARALMWKIADSFIKQRTPKYREMYDRVKKKYLEQEYPKGYLASKYPHYSKDDTKLKPKHAEMRARRYIAKQFLLDFWLEWRKREGLPITPPYSAKFHPESQLGAVNQSL